jgi:hypothetical protein
MKRTVFVLGAGSSAVYQFPVGERLCQLVCDELGTNSQHGINLRKYTTFKDEEITDFCRQLRMSAQPSVDAFLEYRTEFLDLGKAAMALMLVGHEASDRLWDPRDDNWMRYLFRHLNAPFETFHEIPVSFITFNYDRSLEAFPLYGLAEQIRKDGSGMCSGIGARSNNPLAWKTGLSSLGKGRGATVIRRSHQRRGIGYMHQEHQGGTRRHQRWARQRFCTSL